MLEYGHESQTFPVRLGETQVSSESFQVLTEIPAEANRISMKTDMTIHPDTRTLAGKIAVMQAALDGEDIQVRCRTLPESTWVDIRKPELSSWDWMTHDYRIAPEPPKEPRYRPWKSSEVPVGAVVMDKGSGFKHLIVSYRSGYVFVAGGQEAYLPDVMLQEYTMLDGSPCGVKE